MHGPHQNERLINFLAREKHTTPFMHPTATFRCKAPIFMARQLAKHKVGWTWNEVSRHDVTTSPEFWKPDYFQASAEEVKQDSSADTHRRSHELMEDYLDIYIDSFTAYNKMVALGICTEQARAIFPQGAISEWVWTDFLLFWSRVYGLDSADNTPRPESIWSHRRTPLWSNLGNHKNRDRTKG